ncbi:MAG: type II toxin-antitoxin system RelE/ParE family toxin [Cetobacterium sp.]
MDINYKSKKLEKQCNDINNAQKDFGEQITKKLFQRIGELKAAQNLKEMSLIRSARLHSLSGKRENQYAINLTGNWRLILVADDGNMALEKIKIVKIEEVVDYH